MKNILYIAREKAIKKAGIPKFIKERFNIVIKNGYIIVRSNL